jgi:hypothetical protein
MDLELSDGTLIDNPEQSDIDEAISRIGSGLDHCILGEGDSYIQTAGGMDGFLVEYSTGGQFFESTSNKISSQQVKELFHDYLAGGSNWKTMIPFQPQDIGVPESSGSGAAGVGRGGTPQSFTAGSLKETFTGAAKQEAVNSVSYMIRRVVRRFMRRIF